MSREIDRKVAEALGWVKNDNPRPSGQLYGSYEWTDPQGHAECTESMIPNYSTDIAAAIGALEEYCKREGKGWEITKFRRQEDKPMCTILSFTEMDNGPITEGTYDLVTGRCFALGDTLPLAICAAILSANAGESSASSD